MKAPYTRSIKSSTVFNSKFLMQEIVGSQPSVASALKKHTGQLWSKQGNDHTLTAGEWTVTVSDGSIRVVSPTASHVSSCSSADAVARVMEFLLDKTPRFKRLLKARPVDLDSGDSDPEKSPTLIGTLIARADWAVHVLTPAALPGYESTATWSSFDDGWTSYSKVGDYLHCVYPDTTGANSNGGVSVNIASLDLAEVYIEFQVRYPRPTPFKQGLKFCKVFGDDGDGVTTFDSANVTYNPDYDGDGAWSRISFGDGTTTGNDTSNNIWFGTVDGNPASAGYNASWVGRIYPSEVVERPYAQDYVFDDQDWHTVRIIHAYNTGTTSGNEVANAKAIIWVDGVQILNATGFFNRHPTNPRRIKGIEFGGWTQNTGEFDIDYKNIKISTGSFI